MRSFWILRSIQSYFPIDISGQPIVPTLKDQGVQEDLHFLTHEDGTRYAVPKRRQETTTLRCVKCQREQISNEML